MDTSLRAPSRANRKRARAAQTVSPFGPAERAAAGKAERAQVPRSLHAEWQPAADRRDPVDLLEEQAQTRLPDLVPVRYGRMLASAFAFFRGGAYLMASDLSSLPHTGLRAQLCGDAHLSNFGGYAAPDRSLVFSINDFDETLPGPFEWDVKRLAASFAVAGRESGFDARTRRSTILAVAAEYRQAMSRFAAMGNLELWYARLDVAAITARWAAQVNAKQLKQFERNVAKARAKDSLRAFDKLTEIVDGEPRIASSPPLIIPIEEYLPENEQHRLEESIQQIFREHRRSLPRDRHRLLERYRYADAALKVVGVGSVGTRAYIMLLLGRDAGDPLFLQYKEAQSSVLEPFLGKSEFAQHGQRVVEGQKLMQAASDIMLGWGRMAGIDGVVRDFYIRQLWDAKGSATVELMQPRQLDVYAEMCGWALAHSHARSGDAIAISSYLGRSDAFDRALATFAEAYADQNERDYKVLQEAVASGRITAKTDL